LREPKDKIQGIFMIATLSLVTALIFGLLQLPFWFVLPLAVISNFIGMHTPPERIERLREMGVGYWSFFFTNFPLIACISFGFYGVGYGLSAIYPGLS
jgi:hypothetical protein